MIGDRIVRVTIHSFSTPNHVSGYETVCRAHNIGIQHVNMSFEHGAHHFTWFLHVLRAFVSVSELIWAILLLKKDVKLRHQIHKNLDFLTMT